MAAAAETVAIIGVGIMGGAIARNLAKNGLAVRGFDTAPDRMAALTADGGTPAASALEASRGVGLVLTSLPSVAALEATVTALLAEPRAGLVVAELSTLPIADKERCRDRLASGGIVLLDCPLSGTGAQAVTGDLVVYGSGERAGYDRAEPTFLRFARACHYLGAFGNGSKMKFVANLLVAVHNVASAEAMVLGIKAGLDPDTIVKVIGAGAGTSRVFELRAPLMARRAYRPPTMKIDVWQKDMAIIAAFARSLGIETPTFSATEAVYDAAQSEGFGGDDTAAVCALLEKRAGVKRG
jgi:3-hydroxyisobutyrate dehydrogenase-like beta-hydroxyacid dehydrogenase